MKLAFPWLLTAVASCCALSGLAAEPVSPALTPEQVACEQAQLQRLVHRMVVNLSDSNLIAWSGEGGSGHFQGLVVPRHIAIDSFVTEPHFRREETQLAFYLQFRAASDRLDPARSLLPQALLVRRDAASNLYQPTDLFAIDVHLDVAPEVPNAFERTLSLDITNEPNQDRSERAGRGIVTDDLALPCHDAISELDRFVLTLLSRTLRASAVLYPPGFCCGGNSSIKITLLRAPEPFHYWAEVHRYSFVCDDGDETCEHGFYVSLPIVLLEFAFETDLEGRLTTGTVRFLPECAEGQTLGCSPTICPQLGIFLTPPLTPGRDRQDQSFFDRGAFLRCDVSNAANTVTSAPLDWADLLRDTAWNGEP